MKLKDVKLLKDCNYVMLITVEHISGIKLQDKVVITGNERVHEFSINSISTKEDILSLENISSDDIWKRPVEFIVQELTKDEVGTLKDIEVK